MIAILYFVITFVVGLGFYCQYSILHYGMVFDVEYLELGYALNKMSVKSHSEFHWKAVVE